MFDDLEYAAGCAEEYDRRIALDPLRLFASFPQDYPKQEDFFTDDDTREVHMLGANRTGKTKALCARVARLVRSGKAKRIIIISRSAATNRQIIAPYLYEGAEAFIPQSEIAKVRYSPDHEVLGHDGWEIFLKSNEQGADKIAGLWADELDFDEPPDWPMYNEAIIRIQAGKQTRIRIAATLLPSAGEGGGICQWLWSEKIEPWLNKRAPADFRIINVAMRDNPYITPEQLAVARSLYPVGSLEHRIRIEGELLPGLIGQRAYIAFDRKLHVNKHIGPQSINPMLPLYIGVDVNADPLCCIIMQQHGKIWRALDEVVQRHSNLAAMGEALRERFGTHRHEIVICGDAMGTHVHAQTGQTDYQLLTSAMSGMRVRVSVPQKNPPDRDRVNLVNFLLGAGGSPVKYEVSASCPELIADYEQVLMESQGGHIKKSHKPEDPYYQRTHISDASGYVLWAREASAITQHMRPVTRTKIPQMAYGFQRVA